MTQSDRAILCATLTVRESDEENFVAWHTREHLPERLAIPGFLRGRRFECTDAKRCYLILYDVDSLSVLSRPDYLERLNNPTAWTRATLPAFQDGRRSAYRLMAKAGNAEGAFVMMVSARPSDPLRLNEAITPELLDGWCKRRGIARIVLAQPDETASTHVTEESRRSGNRFAEEWVFLVEGISEAHLRDFARDEFTASRCDLWGVVEDACWKIYGLQVSVGDL
ncbi:hypothetical protein AWB70_02014 [Caballeronia cordobensis]|uniref:Uncharacterized protein n=1 Tax=Caballeronia cordobensis TaxID=1353886 RepID=A0A158GHJ4_CABCO|nr:DUF4286 family protein [Caballeronia cordobensis]SAL31492.1 hypothetical protein AWB70_02014 [Caballeronia cordobensis]